MKFMNRLLMIGAITTSLAVAVSCDDEEDKPIENTPDFSAEVSSSYKFTAPSGIVVNFTDKSQNVSAYSWDFGDGSEPSTEASPSHVYALPGTYTVELTTASTTGAQPATAKKSMQLDVVDPTLSLTNIVQGGTMEAVDQNKWTVILSGQKTVVGGVKTFNHVKYEFGSTANLPTGGSGGGFHISNSLPGEEVGSVFYQEVNLTAGIYRFTTLIKHGAEDRTGPNSQALKEYWFEMFVGKRKPTFDPEEPAGNDNGYNDNDPTPDGQPGAIAGFFFNGWTGRPAADDYKATDGTLPRVAYFVPSNSTDGELKPRKARTRADMNGVFEITAANAGAYYVIFKTGKTPNGGFGPNGITIDNVRLVKLQ